VELADLNGDGNLDILTGLEDVSGSGDFRFYLGGGKGDFAKPLTVSGATKGDAYLVGDLNRDGKLDVVISRSDGWQVLLNTCP
ncbi:MAG TPA: VCBS repeat-containing protein, partial [Polyangia bacterium]